jgi:exodeoxyribonuclease-5
MAERPPPPPLTPHQQEAVTFVLDMLVMKNAPLVALTGLAGTGKTTLLPHLREALAAEHRSSCVGAPTHRAAMILRTKGIVDADTLHAHALTPYFKADYARAGAWLGAEFPTHGREGDFQHDDIDGIPWLIYQAVKPDLKAARNLHRQKKYKAQRLLRSVGIDGKDYFDGFGAKEGSGVLIIDEASMVGLQMLALCQEAFPQIVLIGDPGQLPPVNDTPVLADPAIPSITLTEIHRQAQDSPIIQLAYQARAGKRFWQNLKTLATSEAIVKVRHLEARELLQSPLIVWRNEDRIAATHAIRKALDYQKQHLYHGEPLVCKATSDEDRAMGLYNNGLYRIMDIDPNDLRMITVLDSLGNPITVRVHMEEVDGDRVDPRCTPFRFGYCLTCHTAQGGEWPTVYLSTLFLAKLTGFAVRRNQQEQLTQWAYTAVTRAKTTLGLLTSFTFLTEQEALMARIAPPSAPLLTELPTELPTSSETDPLASPPEVTPPEVSPVADILDVDDDIPEVVVPETLAATLQPPTPALPGLPAGAGAYDAILQGFAQHMQRHLLQAMQEVGQATQRQVEQSARAYHHDAMESLQQVCEAVKKWIDAATKEPNEHALYQLANTLAQGVLLRGDPYRASVQAVSPEGFGVTIHVAKQDTGELVTALPALLAWMKEQGYQPSEYALTG